MSAQWPEPVFVDGLDGADGVIGTTNAGFSKAQPIGLPQFVSPLPNSTSGYVFRQLFMQALASWTPAALNTPHPSAGLTPDYSTWYLIAEGPREDCGAGIVKWQRTYSQVPASWSDYSEALAYNLIGTTPYLPAIYSAGTVMKPGRFRRTERVPCRVQTDYFFVAATTGACLPVDDPITGTAIPWGTTPSEGNIPVIFALAYCQQWVVGSTQYGGYDFRQDYVSDYTFGYQIGETTPSYLATSSGVMAPTTPTQTQYLAMCLDASKNGWGATVSQQVLITTASPTLVNVPTSVYGGQLAAENSTLERWQRSGNIWVRRTKYVLAR